MIIGADTMTAATIKNVMLAGNVENGKREIGTIEIQERIAARAWLMDFLEISRSTIYRLMAKGMPNIMVGSVHRFPVNQVVEWWKHKAEIS